MDFSLRNVPVEIAIFDLNTIQNEKISSLKVVLDNETTYCFSVIEKMYSEANQDTLIINEEVFKTNEIVSLDVVFKGEESVEEETTTAYDVNTLFDTLRDAGPDIIETLVCEYKRLTTFLADTARDILDQAKVEQEDTPAPQKDQKDESRLSVERDSSGTSRGTMNGNIIKNCQILEY